MPVAETYKGMNELDTYVLPGSRIIGMTVQDLEDTYGVVCSSVSDIVPKPRANKYFLKDIQLGAWTGINVWGRAEDISRLLLDLNPV